MYNVLQSKSKTKMLELKIINLKTPAFIISYL
jgi:hypothetical protein